MQQGTRLVFDELLNIDGGTIMLTSLEHTDFLSDAQQLGLQAIFSTSATSGSVTVAVQIQQSADGRNWLNKNPAPELFGSFNPTSGVGDWVFTGGESWPTRPRLRFVMLAIVVFLADINPRTSRLQIFATARARTRLAREPIAAAPHHFVSVSRREAMASLLGMRPSTLEEVEMHAREAPPGEGLHQLARRLSPTARADFHRVTRIFRALDPEQRRATLTFASALASMAMLPPETPDNLDNPESTTLPQTR